MDPLKTDSDNKYYIFFVINLLIFLATELSLALLDYLYKYGLIFGIVSTVLFLVYAFFYIFKIKNNENGRNRLLDVAFSCSLLNFIAMFIYAASVSNIILTFNYSIFYPIFIGTILMVCILLPLFMGAYLIAKKHKMYGYIFLSIVLILSIFFFLSGFIIKSYSITDEIFIGVRSISYLLNGMSPYQNSVVPALYQNRSVFGLTVTTGNKIVGTLNYPALYLFASLPFYFAASSPTVYNIEHYILPLQVTTFLLFLFFAIAISIDTKNFMRPIFGLAILLGIFLVDYVSVVSFLMLAMLILAYKYTGTKYFWVLIGLCLSVQELLWFPILLLWLYSVNKYGLKKGIYEALGALFIFLIINSYFIALNYHAFFNSILDPLQKMILTTGNSSFGFALQYIYPVPLNTYSLLFGIAILILVIAFVYLDNKRLVGLFSIIPFLFVFHSSVTYCIFFMAFMFVTLFIKTEDRKPGLITSHLKRSKKAVFSTIMALALVFALVIFASHAIYLQGFNVRVSSQQLYYDAQLNKTVYTARLDYSNLLNNSAYIEFFIYNNWQVQALGIGNYSLINNSAKCNYDDYGCLWNVNRIALSNRTGTYQIQAYLWNGNAVSYLKNARLVLYSGKYVYVANPISG